MKDPAIKARLVGAALGFVLSAFLFGAVELAALEVHGCNAWTCQPERIR